MDNTELLFFDTFSHDISEVCIFFFFVKMIHLPLNDSCNNLFLLQELNLDLVQFPKPVYISEVRIIPLGARVQADFPGGVRLG